MGDNPLDNYSPFDDDEKVTVTAKPSSITADYDEDDEEIKAYEQRLNVLESRINAQETQLTVAQENGFVEPPANWPPFYPFVYFDPEEVPPALRDYVNAAMFDWYYMAIAFAVNFITSLCLLRAGDAITSPGSKIALASLYLFIVPLSLDLSSLAVYRAMKNEPSYITYVKVFISLFALTIFEAFMTLGLDSSGGCGLITTLLLFGNAHWFLGLFGLITTLCFAWCTYRHFKLGTGIWKYYKTTEEGQNWETTAKDAATNILIDVAKGKAANFF